MDVSAVSANSLTDLQSQAALLMQRKAQDIAASNAAQLIETLPQPAAAPDPNATVGGKIDVFV
ncbi:MAG TPA: putative motility protein [Denitromonas sp.]|uniref:putative motility protein n=1 Tax=Denitromonas sp. TaxID=2734609 RepID=UPI001D541073|nr:YjfB family protein [Rhodocyclaceae bacterium]MCP5220908.1 YjfB family protein [Zoogloeaceae bacterium]HPR06268.1 putative motility protein [Denitromonas sp.]HQU87200.1 putative motility protein [Denitromonas sp.]HQV13535.1 putative motility protein [Denitromonas sp.]